MKKKDYSNRINQLLYEEKFFGVLVFKKYANLKQFSEAQSLKL